MNAHAEGEGNTASGRASHAEGGGVDFVDNPAPTLASGDGSHAEGVGTIASGIGSHAEGGTFDITITPGPQALGDFSHAEGRSTTASGDASHAEGIGTTAIELASHAEGIGTIASGIRSHAEGAVTTASGDTSHAEGDSTEASGTVSHAEGSATTASGLASHAEGEGTTASGRGSHAEGGDPNFLISSIASGDYSHAEGNSTTASGFASHAEGKNTTASGDASHAEGEETNTAGFANSHIMGRFGDANEANSWFIGNGTSPLAKGLGAKWDGSSFDMFVDGMYLSPAADYAEMFETLDGNSIDVGYFVTTKGKKIRKATSSDHFILGITSATPSILGNSAGLRWQGKYVTDKWGRKTYHEVTIPAKKDKEGNVLIPERKEMQVMLNPAWNPDEEYIPRTERPEWVAVGLIGQVLVRDDGTCEVDSYCMPNDEGIATKASQGYRVLERTGENQVLVLFNSVPVNQSNLVKEIEELTRLKEQVTLLFKKFSLGN
ncbi:hypothetical protein LIT38_05535 [Bacillus sp. CMF12]|uniref:peptidase G2 autoproteolytic cleavage domain-containing protein n=1 Tax=Bacillus sp. CMF12 TaxID=2884834 RepID=UPI002079D3C5|nr:peptidase G2 autoproteolytic cleavage domain-containing protein [Bacillus sp. CMF12]USK50923.1 hypothetical protein LIT38_05535 [Bacillus sp. CMF12]